MPVDKFGRNGDRATPVYTGINIANLTNTFLRRDGGNTAIGAIDMNSNIIKHLADQLSNKDVVNKNYTHTYAFSTAGGVLQGSVVLSIASDFVRILGCGNLSAGKKFILMLGSYSNMPTYSIPKPFVLTPIKLKTDASYVIRIEQCGFSQDLILCSQPIDMNQHSIKNVKSLVNKFDAVNKAYTYRIKYKSVTGTIPNTVRTDHTLFTFLATKDIISEKIIICEM